MSAGRRARTLALALASTLATGPLWAGQAVEEAAASSSTSPVVDDVTPVPAEPDFVVITLPTTLRLPRHRAAFRVTHRFDRPLGDGNFGDLAADFFGFDSTSTIALEVRFSLFTGTDIGFHRTSERTIRFFVQKEIVRQGDLPLGIAAIASVEGLDNFKEDHSPQVGVVLSRKLGTRGALYLVPSWVGNTNLRAHGFEQDDSTFALGLGGRIRIRDTVSVVGEWTPRLFGFKGDRGGRTAGDHASFGIEKRVGGHSFQLNFSNDLGTTPAETARGRQGVEGWFIGFNISRKFY